MKFMDCPLSCSQLLSLITIDDIYIIYIKYVTLELSFVPINRDFSPLIMTHRKSVSTLYSLYLIYFITEEQKLIPKGEFF